MLTLSLDSIFWSLCSPVYVAVLITENKLSFKFPKILFIFTFCRPTYKYSSTFEGEIYLIDFAWHFKVWTKACVSETWKCSAWTGRWWKWWRSMATCAGVLGKSWRVSSVRGSVSWAISANLTDSRSALLITDTRSYPLYNYNPSSHRLINYLKYFQVQAGQ